MPQITLEYTDNIKDAVEFHALFRDLHKIIHDITGVNMDNCKSRARKADCYFIGTGEISNAFVNLDIFLLAGRTLEVKQLLGTEVLKLLKKYFAKAIEELTCQITIKIEDILRDTYFKYPEGSFTPQSHIK